MSAWCSKWHIAINNSKSKVVHFRKSRKQITNFVFSLCGDNLEVVPKYKYLGLYLDEHLNFKEATKILSDSSYRALGNMINIYKSYKSMGYATFTKLFEACVCPILDYCCPIWGFPDFDILEQVQCRAMRIFLGVHRFIPRLVLYGEMGWTTCLYRRKIQILKFWNRLIGMSEK